MFRWKMRFWILGALVGVIFLFSATPVWTAPSDIQITEIMYNPDGTDTDHEWVELKNTGSESVEIVGTSKTGSWRFFDGSNRLFSTSTILAPGAYLIVARSTTTFSSDHTGFVGQIVQSSFTLTNTTGAAAFIDQDGVQRSRIDYFSSWGADDNGKTLEKKNLTGDNSVGNWQESAMIGGTPGADNSVPNQPPEPPPPEAPAVPPAPSSNSNEDVKIIINEFLSDPGQNEKEWVEVYNAGNRALDLTGWRIEEGSEEETKLAGTIAPQGYFLLEAPKGNLNNAGDIIQLFDYNGSLQDKVAYGSWDDGNKFDNAPVAYDGKSVGRLIGTDTGNNKTDLALTLRPTPRLDNLFGIISSNLNQGAQSYSSLSAASIILNEILPNPKGSDQDKEFIELKNISADGVNLGGWKLTNQGGSSYALPTTTTISAGGFLVVPRQNSRLALKNTGGETLELYDPANHLVDKAVYEDEAADDLSYNRLSSTSTVWQWSKALTPGRENIINAPNLAPQIFVVLPNAMSVGEEVVFDASDTFDPDDEDLNFQWELEGGIKAEGDVFIYVFESSGSYSLILKVTDGHGNKVEKKMTIKVWAGGEGEMAVADTKEISNPQSSKSGSGNKVGEINLEQIKNLSAGDWVTVRGAVAVLPNVFSSQNFYIVDQETQSGVAVYMFKKDWPDLKIGSIVEVAGQLGSYQNNLRLKTKTRNDIQILSTGEPPQPTKISTADLDEDNLFSLVEIEGEVVEAGSGYFYLADEDGEVNIQLKKNIKWKKGLVKVGDRVKVAGILGKSKDEFSIWPGMVEGVENVGGSSSHENGQIFGADKKAVKKYAAATGGGLVGLVAIFLARTRGLLAKNLIVGVLGRGAFWKKKDDNFPPLN